MIYPLTKVLTLALFSGGTSIIPLVLTIDKNGCSAIEPISIFSLSNCCFVIVISWLFSEFSEVISAGISFFTQATNASESKNIDIFFMIKMYLK